MQKVICALLIFAGSICWGKNPTGLKSVSKLDSASVHVAKPSPFKIENLKPAERQYLGRMVSFTLLHQIAADLTAFYDYGDNAALAKLLEPWGPEESLEIKRELLAVKERPKFQVHSETLFITLSEGVIEFKVEDPFDGLFKIDGKLVKIQPNSKYRYFKEKLGDGSDVSLRLPFFFDLVLPKAQAGMWSAAAEMLRKPVAAAAGGAVKEGAAKQVDNVGDAFMEMLRQERAALTVKQRAIKAAKVATPVVGVPLVFNCVALNTEWDPIRNKCIDGIAKIPAKVLCTTKLRTEGCISNVGEFASALNAPTTATGGFSVKPVNGDECVPGEAGSFKKDIQIEFDDVPEAVRLAKANPDGPVPLPLKTIHVHLEYQAVAGTGNGPTVMAKKSIVQLEKNAKGNIIKRRNWTFTGDKWDIDTWDTPQSAQATYTANLVPAPPRKISCSKDKLEGECSALYNQVLIALGPLNECKPKNPAQVDREVKAELKGGNK
jgi:hypothetical protein